MFTKSERIFLNDPNAKRFNGSCITNTVETPCPGPTSYNPLPPTARTTRKHTFLRDHRRPLNEIELKNDVPGPGWYASGNAPHTERKADQGNSEYVFGSVRKRQLNMININNSHSLKEYDEVKNGKPGPANYSIPSLFQNTTERRSAVMKGPGRKDEENLDGRAFGLISQLPAPGAYESLTPRPPKGGTMSSLPRGLEDKIREDPNPGPGQYSLDPPQSRLRVRISCTPRNLGQVVCGTDLRKQRRYPGPASYHPIHDNIVKQDYTV